MKNFVAFIVIAGLFLLSVARAPAQTTSIGANGQNGVVEPLGSGGKSTASPSATPTPIQVFNVKAFGAQGVGGLVRDAAIPAAQATLTATATFPLISIFSFGGVNTSSPIDVHSKNNGSTATSLVATGVTTTQNADLLLSYYGLYTASSTTITPPGSVTAIQHTPGNGTAPVFGSNAYTKVIATAGATGNITETSLTSPNGWGTMNIALAPAVAGVAPVLHGTMVSYDNFEFWPADNTVAGDVQVMCMTVDVATGSVTTPGGWTLIDTTSAVNTGVNCYWQAVASTPPGSILTSASANWTSGVVGDLICVQGTTVANGSILFPTVAGPSYGNRCGSVLSFISSTQLGLSFSNENSSNTTGVYASWATNDTSAIGSAIAAMPKGGELYFPQGNYGLGFGQHEFDTEYDHTSAELIMPPSAFVMRGAGAMIPAWIYAGGLIGVSLSPPAVPLLSGTMLSFLTYTATAPGIFAGIPLASQPEPQTINSVYGTLMRYTMRDFGVWAGVGVDYRGMGGSTAEDCIQVDSSRVNGLLDGVYEGNCSGNGLSFPTNSGGITGDFYSDLQIVRGGFYTANGVDGVNLNFGDPAAWKLEGNEIDGNQRYGVNIVQGCTGCVISNNIIQWNNQAATNPGYDLFMGTGTSFGAGGALVQGNYFEDILSGAHTTFWNLTKNWTGASFLNNGYNSSETPPFQAFSGSSTVGLLACAGGFVHTAPQCVTDAAACTNGTTYAAGGGSVQCMVQCFPSARCTGSGTPESCCTGSGTGCGWVETGQGCY